MITAKELAQHIYQYIDPVVNVNSADRQSVLEQLKTLVDREINRLTALDPNRNR
tara:strand:- start:203 stop:364 length:162 start_codon:yes stop_codon:yes gene_type:complete